MPQRETGRNSCGSGEVTDRRIEFQKRSQLFIRTHNGSACSHRCDVRLQSRSFAPLPSYPGASRFFRVCFSPGYDLALAPRASTILSLLAQYTNESVPAIETSAGSRDHCTSRVCRGLVDGVAQGCNIRSPVALAWRVDADYPLSVTITWSFDATGVFGGGNGPDS